MTSNLPMVLTTYYTVYITVNLLNSQIYIGVHRTTYPLDDYLGSGKYLNRAIDAHGRENFVKWIYALCETEDEAYELEAELVNKEFLRGHVYNLHTGGRGGWMKNYKKGTYIHSDETKRKISESNKGKKRTDEYKEKMSKAKKGKPIPKLIGHMVTEETRQKLSKALKGRRPPNFGTKGETVRMKNTIIKKEKFVKKESEEYFKLVEEGWERGILNPIPKDKRHINTGPTTKNNVCLFNEKTKEVKFAHPDSEKFKNLLDKGFVVARKTGLIKGWQKCSNMVWLTNGTDNARAKPDSPKYFELISLGYYRGKTNHKDARATFYRIV